MRGYIQLLVPSQSLHYLQRQARPQETAHIALQYHYNTQMTPTYPSDTALLSKKTRLSMTFERDRNLKTPVE